MVCITETEGVYCAVRTELFNIIEVNIRLEVFKGSVHVLQETTCYTDSV